MTDLPQDALRELAKECRQVAAQADHLSSEAWEPMALACADKLDALAERMKAGGDPYAEDLADVLRRNGYVKCDLPACNCGSWHHRYGLPERMRDICDELSDADVLDNSTGNLPLNAIRKLREQRDAAIARAEQAELRVEQLQGLKFSDRNYGAMKSRVELANTAMKAARLYVMGEALPTKKQLLAMLGDAIRNDTNQEPRA